MMDCTTGTTSLYDYALALASDRISEADYRAAQARLMMAFRLPVSTNNPMVAMFGRAVGTRRPMREMMKAQAKVRDLRSVGKTKAAERQQKMADKMRGQYEAGMAKMQGMAAERPDIWTLPVPAAE